MSGSQESEGRFSVVHDGFVRVNAIGGLIGFGILFPPVTPRPPANVFPELDFIRLVSWLYANWHEAGRVSTAILSDAIDVFSPEARDLLLDHVGAVASHRTLLHHNVGGEAERGDRTRLRCEAWFGVACSKPEPDDQNGWWLALNALLNEARLALETAEATLRRLHFDTASPDWVARWRLARDKELDDGELDGRIASLARQMGVGPLRTPEFRRRFRSGWVQQVRLCPATEISGVLDRAIVRDLLTYGQRQHPLLPSEVMTHLSIAAGPLVGEAMRLALRLHADNPCPTSELLQRLAQVWSTRETNNQ